MKNRLGIICGAVFIFLPPWLEARAASVVDARWSRQATPSPGPARAIGSTSHGCLAGAAVLSLRGPGYRVDHPERKRRFGHPALIEYIHRLAAAAREKKLGIVVVGDLAQARGGPAPSGHKSHQTGLDADITFDMKSKSVARMLELAASGAAVDRMFVHPSVKRDLCQGPARGAAWLGRIRPWWGHLDHFHVRLACPAGSPACTPSDPVAPGDGCDATLDWWFSGDASEAREKREAAGAAAGVPVALPDACEELVR